MGVSIRMRTCKEGKDIALGRLMVRSRVVSCHACETPHVLRCLSRHPRSPLIPNISFSAFSERAGAIFNSFHPPSCCVCCRPLPLPSVRAILFNKIQHPALVATLPAVVGQSATRRAERCQCCSPNFPLSVIPPHDCASSHHLSPLSSSAAGAARTGAMRNPLITLNIRRLVHANIYQALTVARATFALA